MAKPKPKRRTPSRTRAVIDHERYTLAMFMLGYSVGMIHSLMKEPAVNAMGRYKADFEWLQSRVGILMNLNEERGTDDAPKDDAPGPKSHN